MHATVLALILVAAQARPDAPDPAGPSIVSGRVVDAGTGRPIAGAVVMPFGPAAAPRAGDAAPAPRTLTNADGRFVIRGLQTGNLILIATKGGYVDASHGQVRAGGFGQPVRIVAGQRHLDVDVRMWRHGVITGTVVDESGDPVIGVRVDAFLAARAGGRTSYSRAADATTDDRGVYRIPGLLPGTYIVGVLSKQTSIPTEVVDVFFAGTSTRTERDQLGRELQRIDAPVVPAGSRYATSIGAITLPLEPGTATPTSRPDGGLLIYPTVFYPSAPAAAQAAPIAVSAGVEQGSIDLQLHAERATRVSGVLAGPEGMAAHTAVRLVLAGNEQLAGAGGAAAITDATGAFTFAGVPPGQYTLAAVRVPRPFIESSDPTLTVLAGGVAVAPRPPSAPVPAPPPPVPDDATLWAAVPIAVGDAELDGVVVQLRRGPRMTGRLDFDGTAERPDAALVSNLRIVLEPADGLPPPGGLDGGDSGHPDEHGGFRTPGVFPGRYVVRVAGLPLPGWTFRAAEYRGRDLADTAVEMTAEDVDGVVLSFTDRPSSIEGRVQTGGSPADDGLVVAYPTDEASWSNAGAAARRIKVARAQRDGTFALANVPPGEYFIVAVKDAVPNWQDPSLLRTLSPGAARVRVAEGERKAVVLRMLAR